MKQWREMKRVSIFSALLATFFIVSVVVVPVSKAEDVNPYGGAKVSPPAATEVILTVSKGTLSKGLSMKDLMAMKSANLVIHEPFVKKVQSFRVIQLKEIFALVGIKGADRVQTIALNDYIYTNTAQSFLLSKGYLAIARSGKPIGYDQGGPIRIIFSDKSKWSKFLDPWNWSLKKIRVT